MTHTFDKGDRVAIINSTLGGRFFVECYASIVKLLDTEEYYRVRMPDGETYDRFVDPAAQSDPENFVANLNQKT